MRAREKSLPCSCSLEAVCQSVLSYAYISTATTITVGDLIAQRPFEALRKVNIGDVCADFLADDGLQILALPDVNGHADSYRLFRLFLAHSITRPF